MARPQRDPRSGIYHLKQRTPADLLGKLKGTTVTLPVGDRFAAVRIGAEVETSLRTRDPQEAKERHAVADAALKRHWAAHRNGPARLTHKQAVALAGTLYQGFTAAFEDDPAGVDWTKVQRADLRASQGLFGMSALRIGDDATRRAGSHDERFGNLADALIAREGLVIDADSRTRLVEAVAAAMSQAVAGAARMAAGDYSPDPAASRFPAWLPPEPERPAQPRDTA